MEDVTDIAIKNSHFGGKKKKLRLTEEQKRQQEQERMQQQALTLLGGVGDGLMGAGLVNYMNGNKGGGGRGGGEGGEDTGNNSGVNSGSNNQRGQPPNPQVTNPHVLDRIWYEVDVDRAMTKVMHRLREKRSNGNCKLGYSKNNKGNCIKARKAADAAANAAVSGAVAGQRQGQGQQKQGHDGIQQPGVIGGNSNNMLDTKPSSTSGISLLNDQIDWSRGTRAAGADATRQVSQDLAFVRPDIIAAETNCFALSRMRSNV